MKRGAPGASPLGTWESTDPGLGKLKSFPADYSRNVGKCHGICQMHSPCRNGLSLRRLLVPISRVALDVW